MGEEKRQHPRLSFDIKASYQLDSDPRTFCCATMLNVSAGGFAFYTNDRIEIGDHVTLNVRMNDDVPVPLAAEVVWSKKVGDSGQYMSGVTLLDDEASQGRSKLAAFCEQIART